MRLNQVQFYLKFGIREYVHLDAPRLSPVNRLTLPLESVYHFYNDSSAVMGPSQTDPVFNRLESKVYIKHIENIDTYLGNPIRTNVLVNTLINDFRRQHRFFRPLKKLEALTLNNQNVLTVNYNLLSYLYRYQKTFKATWFKWNNEYSTFWDNVKRVTDETNWNQFIELQLPDQLPSFIDFGKVANDQSQKNLERFNSSALLCIMDLLRWLSDNRQSALMDRIPEQHYSKINFIIRANGTFTVLNLKLLDDWRKDPTDKNDKGRDPLMLSRKVFSLIAALTEFNKGQITEEPVTVVDDEPITETEVEVVPTETVDEEDVLEEPEETKVPETDKEVDIGINPISFDDFLKPIKLDDLVVNYKAPESDLFNVKLVIEKDEELAEVQKTLNVTEQPTSVNQPNKIQVDHPLLEETNNQAYELYRLGLISAKVYEQSITNAESFKAMPNPFTGQSTIAESMVITEDDLKMESGALDRDISVIADKSLLKSNIKPSLQKYINQVYPKHLMQMVMSVQNQGVAVTSWTVEHVHDALNNYQQHTLVIKPIKSKPFSVRFALPVIDEDGRFTANSVTYRQRAQRGD